MTNKPKDKKTKKSEAEPWPPYRVGDRDYIHALGVIASVFNLLEFRLRSLFPIYTGLASPPAYNLFAKIDNQKRLELMRGSIPFSDHPDAIKDDVLAFSRRVQNLCGEQKYPDAFNSHVRVRPG